MNWTISIAPPSANPIAPQATGEEETLRSGDVSDLPLACTVRGCARPLAREPQRFVCPRGHAYDVARSGYVNLLQPQDRRSVVAGDTKEVVQARAAVIAAGVGKALFARVAALAGAHVGSGDVVIDLGCGTGDALRTLADGVPLTSIGIDLSPAAAELAAKRSPDLNWVVANADRRLPLLDRSVALALSLHGRRNAAECARVLRPAGVLIVAVPALDDLAELRTALHGRAVDRSRDAGVRAEHASAFVLAEHLTVRDRVALTADALRALLRITYRGGRTSAAAHVDALSSMDVTVASDIFVFARQ